MKKFAAALSATALIALSACAEPADDTTDGEVMTAEETTVINETPDTVVVDEDGATDGDSVSISEDGVTADINDGNTSVNANVSDDPSLTVETE